MKAPEKIRVHELLLKDLSVPSKEYHTVEYTRTDAFIDKACAFIRERLIFDDDAWYTDGELTLKDKAIEAFKSYMKGE